MPAALPYNVSRDNKWDIKKIIQDFFKRCDVPYQVIPYDTELWNACLKRAKEKGYPVEPDSPMSLYRSFKVGVVITRTSYGHIQDYEILIWVATFTAFVTYADDAFQEDIQHLHSFARTFLQNEKHEHPVLEAFAQFLRESSIRFSHFVANTVVSSALRFMMSIALEFEGQNVSVSTEAREYPGYIRILSGLSDIYALFAFPMDLPRSTYIQAFPEQIDYINGTNDLLSFYKEELDCETVNFISAAATSQQVSKLEVLRNAAEKAAYSYDVVVNVLKPYPEALAAWKSFARGFCYFHTSSPRYRLGEMFHDFEHDLVCKCASCTEI
ncbi:hypothetical protein CC1G_03563 [Coprinopsis cinerea okayama7|uniref:Alpha-cuprenene synthase COP6 n=1 Tax=Coprinopsis cinerea (strain Okayama-7 / 130 / ATCC MYA-4618 / FGSC 9003) TaxID=240176 RepID=COP6_COPC7|nr:hypothetical protein CC1G_03563 [Coprinopsis cinerea okayama7\|eukprot:XP_001832549.1 hypothetical protein CC1G_03563 [Coprinopsis cinerea okayama7\